MSDAMGPRGPVAPPQGPPDPHIPVDQANLSQNPRTRALEERLASQDFKPTRDTDTGHALTTLVNHVPDLVNHPAIALPIAKNAHEMPDAIGLATQAVQVDRMSNAAKLVKASMSPMGPVSIEQGRRLDAQWEQAIDYQENVARAERQLVTQDPMMLRYPGFAGRLAAYGVNVAQVTHDLSAVPLYMQEKLGNLANLNETPQQAEQRAAEFQQWGPLGKPAHYGDPRYMSPQDTLPGSEATYRQEHPGFGDLMAGLGRDVMQYSELVNPVHYMNPFTLLPGYDRLFGHGVGRALGYAGHSLNYLERVDPAFKMGALGLNHTLGGIHEAADWLQHVANVPKYAGDVAGAPATIAFGPQVGGEIRQAAASTVMGAFDFINHLYRAHVELAKRYGDGVAWAAMLPMLIGPAGVLLPRLFPETAPAAPEIAAETPALIAEMEAGMGVAGAEAAGEAAAVPAAEAGVSAAENQALLQTYDESRWKIWNNLSIPNRMRRALQYQRAMAEETPNFSRGAYTTGQVGAQVLGAPLRAAAIGTRLMASPWSFVGYGAQDIVMHTAFQQEWRDTANGEAWAVRNQQPDTLGWYIASFLPKGEAQQILAHGLNALTYFAIPDPLGAMGRVWAMRFSAEGWPGLLNRFSPGTDLQKALTAYKWVPKFRWWVHYAVEHNAGEIAMANPDIALVADAIDEQKVFNEPGVVRERVLVPHKEGETWYAVDKEGKGIIQTQRYETRYTLNGKALGEPGGPTINKDATRDNILAYLRSQDIAAQLTTRATLPLRGFNEMARMAMKDWKFVKEFQLLPMYQMASRMVKMENREFNYGDKNAVPAIGDTLLQAGYDAHSVASVMNTLLLSDDPRVWRTVLGNAWRGLYWAELAKYVVLKRLSPEVAAEFEKQLEGLMAVRIDELIGSSTGTRNGFFTTLPNGDDSSGVEHHDAQGRASEVRFGAAYPEQLQKGLLPNYHEVRSDVRALVRGIQGQMRSKEFIHINPEWVPASEINATLREEAAGTRQYVTVMRGGEKQVIERRMLEPGEKTIGRATTYVQAKEGWIPASMAAEVPKTARGETTTMVKGYAVARIRGSRVLYWGEWMRDGFNNAVNDRWFKPLALLTGGWALRVSMSEVLLNIMRQGGIKTIAAHYAVGAAEKEAKLLGVLDRLRKGTGDLADERQILEDSAAAAGSWFRRNGIPLPPPREMNHLVALVYSLRLGFDRGIVQSLGESALLDSAMAALWLNQGHIAPAGFLSQHGQGYTTFYDSHVLKPHEQLANLHATPGLLTDAKMAKAKAQRDFTKYAVREDDYGAIRHGRALMLENSRWGRPLVTAFNQSIEDQVKALRMTPGLEPTGRRAFEIPGAAPATGSIIENAMRATRIKALDLINQEGKHWYDFERSGHFPHIDQNDVIRDYERLVDSGMSRDAALKLAHADILAWDIHSFLLGPLDRGDALHDMTTYKSRAEETPQVIEGRFYDGKSARMIRDHAVPLEYRQYGHEVWGGYEGRGSQMFTDLPGPKLRRDRYGMNPARSAAEWVQDRFLGKIVNNLSRDPTFLIDFHNARMLMKDHVEKGWMTQAQADVQAQITAFAKARRFIHNPLDKTIFDERARVIAPFFFAQMQAWRRVGRLWWENPGAFEQYAKLMLGTEHLLSKVGSQNQGFAVIPGFSIWGIGFQAAVDSLASVDPLTGSLDYSGGSQSLWRQLEAVVTPKPGPIGTVPWRLVENWLMRAGWTPGWLKGNLSHWSENLLGSAANQTPLWTQALPNSVLVHLFEAGTGFVTLMANKNIGVLPLGIDESYMSAVNTVVEVKYTQAYQAVWNNVVATVHSIPQADRTMFINPATGQPDLHAYQEHIAVRQMMLKTKDPLWLQGIVENANIQALGLWLVRTAASAISPLSISIGQAYKPYVDYYNSLKKKYGGDWIAAETAFLNKFPWAIALTVSRTQKIEGFSLPDTQGGVDFYNHHAAAVQRWPSAMAMFVPNNARNAPYDQYAANLINLVGLRQHLAPSQFVDALVNATGDAYVHNVLFPWYDYWSQPPTAKHPNTYGDNFNLFTALQAREKGFAMGNPQWGSYYQSHASAGWRFTAVDQMREMGKPNNNPFDKGSANYYAVQMLNAPFTTAPTGPKGETVTYSLLDIAQNLQWLMKSPHTWATMAPYVTLEAPSTQKPPVGGLKYSAVVPWWAKMLKGINNGTGWWPPSLPKEMRKPVGKALTYAIQTVLGPLAEDFSATANITAGMTHGGAP